MHFTKHTKFKKGVESINLAPLIDVIFLLLLFFMLSSSFTTPNAIKIELPKAMTSSVIQDENLIVTITSENVTYVNNRVVTRNELDELLAKNSNKERSLLIKADHRASVGRIVDVWDMCKKYGYQRVNIAATHD